MAITAEDIQLMIVRRLTPSRLARLVSECVDGDCRACGDVCPVRARNWRRKNARRVRNIFSDPAFTVHEVHLSCSMWHEDAGCLADVNVQSIRKTVSRALDSARDPTVIATGLIDAAWSGSKWKIGISLFVLMSRNTADVRRVFERIKDIDWVDVEVQAKPCGRLEELLRAGQHAKTWPDRRILLKPGACREYYRWLASLKARARLFRYGCDHHFNLRNKTLKPVSWHLPKRRKSPTWLAQYQYGSHPDSCSCNICNSQRNR